MAIKLCCTKDMSREEWLEWRRGGIGGSDAATIVGLNPYCSLLELYADKIGMMPDKEDSEAMRIGRDLEEYVASRWAEKTGKKYRKTNYMYAHDQYDFIRANVDREVVGENAGLECKTTSVYNKHDFEDGEIPLWYYCQCQHYMAVKNYDRMHLAILVLGKGFYDFVIERNENEIAVLIDNEIEFWNHHVKAQVPPSPDGSESSANAIKAISSHSNVDSGLSSDLLLLMDKEDDLARYNTLKQQYEELGKEIDTIKQELMLALADNEYGESAQYKVSYKAQSSTRLDSKKLKAECPEIFNKYAQTTVSRVLRINKKKEGKN